MQIDLFTLIAQIFNLLILLFLLRKFLYLPVLKAIEARQKLIADEIENAEIARQKATAAETAGLAAMQKLEKQKQKILEKAEQDASILAEQLKSEAETEYRQKRDQWQHRLKSEQQNFDLSVQKAAAQYFTIFATQAMQQIADTDINQAATQQLIRKIEALPADKKHEYAVAFKSKKQIEIHSATPLDIKLQTKLEECLHCHLSLPAKMQFEYTVKPELIGGVCIVAQEQLIAWNFESYLQEFRQNMNKTVQQLLSRGEK